MKFIALIIAVAATPALANEDVCQSWGEAAQKVMEHRQANTPMSQLMALVSDDDFLRAMVIAAYDTPAFRTSENQANAVADFRNEVEAVCYGTTQ